jgi:N-acetylglucosamine kinase
MPSVNHARCVVGIDVGGTHTRCCVVDERGKILSFGLGGPANRLFVPDESARTAIGDALSQALTSPALEVAELVVAGPHLPPGSLDLIARHIKKEAVINTDEFEVSLAAGTQKSGGWGVVVAAGTGSFCKGCNPACEEEYAGGWGPLIGDEGSGYEIAKEALAAITAAHDGRANDTSLTQDILRAIEIREIVDLKTFMYNPPIGRHQLARLAPYVFAAAEKGDEVATTILENAGNRLAELAEPVVSRLFRPDEQFPVILTGGVMREGSILVRTLISEIKKIRPAADVYVSPLLPLLGTVIIGLDSIGVTIDSDVLDNLKKGDAEIRLLIASRENKK